MFGKAALLKAIRDATISNLILEFLVADLYMYKSHMNLIEKVTSVNRDYTIFREAKER